ncbi:MAG: glycosyltransferase family 4 protein [Clostridia bacterium]
MNTSILFTFITAFAVTFLFTPPVKKLAFKIGAVDVPRDNRRMHKKPTALLGGLAIFAGFLVSALIFVPMDKAFRGILIGSIIIIITGIFDDIYALGAKLKFVIQIGAALFPVLNGVRIDIIAVPKFIDAYGYLDLGYFSIPLTILWIVGVTNAINLLDGLDGLACGVSSISSLTLLCIALLVGEPEIAFATAALAGACFGFLPYNFNPAKLFMGDTGALFLGFMLSTLSIQGLFKGYAVISIAVPFLILGMPLFDTASAMLRRAREHRPIMSPDRGHLHHRLVDAGLSQKQAVAVIYAMCLLLCVIAVLLIWTGAVSPMAILIVIVAFALFMTIVPNFSRMLKDSDEKDGGENAKNK